MIALEVTPRKAPVLSALSATGHRHVLLVEDDEDLNAAISIRLGIEGFVVACTTDGIQALECAIKDPPDAIIMDLTLPRLSGQGLLFILRSIPALAEVPVIVITGAVPGLLTETIAQLDAVKRVLFKPISAQRLARVVAAVIGPRAP